MKIPEYGDALTRFFTPKDDPLSHFIVEMCEDGASGEEFRESLQALVDYVTLKERVRCAELSAYTMLNWLDEEIYKGQKGRSPTAVTFLKSFEP